MSEFKREFSSDPVQTTTISEYERRPNPWPEQYVSVPAIPKKEDWRFSANCREVDPDIFFPPKPGGERSSPDYSEAAAVCSTCPVRVECLEYAMNDSTLDHGFWGGMTPRARQRLRRGRYAA